MCIRDRITGDAVIEDEGFRAFFEGYDGLKIGLTVGAQKLLSTAALYLCLLYTSRCV